MEDLIPIFLATARLLSDVGIVLGGDTIDFIPVATVLLIFLLNNVFLEAPVAVGGVVTDGFLFEVLFVLAADETPLCGVVAGSETNLDVRARFGDCNNDDENSGGDLGLVVEEGGGDFS